MLSHRAHIAPRGAPSCPHIHSAGAVKLLTKFRPKSVSKPLTHSRVGPIYSVIQCVKPKLRFLLRLSAQILSQSREFLWYPDPFPHSLGPASVFQFFRSGTLVQAVLLPSTDSHFLPGPFAPPALPGFFATSSLSDSRPGPSLDHVFPKLGGLFALPCRASQVRRPIFRYAPPPITPESPMTAHSRSFILGTGLRPIR